MKRLWCFYSVTSGTGSFYIFSDLFSTSPEFSKTWPTRSTQNAESRRGTWSEAALRTKLRAGGGRCGREAAGATKRGRGAERTWTGAAWRGAQKGAWYSQQRLSDLIGPYWANYRIVTNSRTRVFQPLLVLLCCPRSRGEATAV